MNKDLLRRQRRAKKTRQKIKTLNVARLSVHITLRHIYAQVFAADGSKVLAQASTLDKQILPNLIKNGAVNKENAAVIGKYIAERALASGITHIGFDRSGYKYHGRIKALADSARENGLNF